MIKEFKKDKLSKKDYKAIIGSDVWKLWELEQHKRFRKQAVVEKRKRLSECYDLSETVELGLMSRNHLISFCKFLIKLRKVILMGDFIDTNPICKKNKK